MFFNAFTAILKFSVSFTSETFLMKYCCDCSGFVSRNSHLLTISVNSLSILSDAPAVPTSYFSNLSTNSSIVAFSSSVSSCWLSFFGSSFSVGSVVSSGFLSSLSSLTSLSSFLFSCVSAAVSFLLFSAVDVAVSGLFNDCSLLQLDNDTEATSASNSANFLMFFIKILLRFLYIYYTTILISQSEQYLQNSYNYTNLAIIMVMMTSVMI